MHGAAAFALRAGLDEGCRRRGFAAVDCPSVVITYNVVDDAGHNARDCGVSKDTWMQVGVMMMVMMMVMAMVLMMMMALLHLM
jgi:hypothetical protein